MEPSILRQEHAHASGIMEETLLRPESVRRIMVCQLRQIGDVLLATPSIELLARHYPQAEIHFFTEKKCVPMLENNPRIAKIWAVDKKQLPTLLHELVFYRKAAAGGFDLVVDFQQLPRCRWVVAMSRAKVRLSFPPPWYLRPLYTHWFQPSNAYAGAFKAAVLSPLGITWQGERPRLYLTGAEQTEARSLLAGMGIERKRFISVDATHRHSTRRWPARHYAHLMDMLARQYPDLHFFLSYGPGEEKDVREIASLVSASNRVHIPPAMLSLRQSAACIAEAALQLGNCSSPRHMATALDVPTFTILGSTSSGWTFPSPEHKTVQAKDYMPMPCQPCNANTCDRNRECLEKLLPEMIFPAVCEHLEVWAKTRDAKVS